MGEWAFKRNQLPWLLVLKKPRRSVSSWFFVCLGGLFSLRQGLSDLGYPWTSFVIEDDLELLMALPPSPAARGLQVCATTPVWEIKFKASPLRGKHSTGTFPWYFFEKYFLLFSFSFEHFSEHVLKTRYSMCNKVGCFVFFSINLQTFFMYVRTW